MPTADHAALPPTDVERWITAHLAPERMDSARALYEWMPRQRGGQLPLVDVPYDPFSESHWAEAARIADYVAHAPADARRVLDIGPGDGWPALPVAAARPDLQIIGVDPSPLRIRVCIENARRLGFGNARFVVGDGAALPLPTASIDLVTAASSIEEASAPEGVLTEIARVLRPGGVLRASSQDWRLGVPGWESIMLWEGASMPSPPAGSARLVAASNATSGAGASDTAPIGRVLLVTYVRRSQQPPIERRYTLVLRADDAEAARLHTEALIALADGRRAYGETLLAPAFGVPLLERLAPHVERCTLVELHRWSTPALVAALRAAGFAEARATVHPGELGRRFARDLLGRNAMMPFVPVFADATRALGTLAGSQQGEGMVTAVR